MKGVRKKFEPDLYTQFDGPAKEAMRIHLTLSGHEVTVPPENYYADLYSTFLGVKMYHETEVSRGWKDNEHPFGLGSIPERKIRLVNAHKINCEPLFFWMLRLDLGRALVFSGSRMIDQYLVEVPNRKVAKGELFYRIPKHLGKEFDLLKQEDINAR